MINKVYSILSRILRIDLEKMNENFSQLDHAEWDSLAHLRVVVELEREFKVRFEPREIGMMFDVLSIVKVLEQKQV